MLHDLQLANFVISETKLDDSFPSAQFSIENYEIRAKRGRYGHGKGLIEFVKRGIICERLKQFETLILESICSEVTIFRMKWFCMGIYKLPNFINLNIFFKEVSVSLSKASLTYENFIVMGDFNIDIDTTGIDVDKLDEFCNLFDLTNLIKTETCCTKNHKSTIDLFLTNRPLSFQKNRTTETGISDYHELISTFFKSHYTRLKPKIIYYRNYKNFNKELFLKDLENSNLSANSDNLHKNYTNLSQTFSKIVQEYASLKIKILRGNHAPFINREFRKEIYKHSRLGNKFFKDPSEEDKLLFTNQRNKCVESVEKVH